MNRFKIAPGREKDFEKIWKERETHLDNVPGFLEFRFGGVCTGFETETATTIFLLHGPRGQNETCLYYHGMVYNSRWVLNFPVLLFAEIWKT